MTVHDRADELLTGLTSIQEVIAAIAEVDAPIAILGNAPSINDLDKKKLDDCVTLGVNRISRFYTPNILLYTESDMFSPDNDLLYPDAVVSEAVVKIAYGGIERPFKSIPFYKEPLYELGFEWEGGLRCKQSIFAVIHLAMLSKCSPVYLCGVDLTSKHDHFWGDTPPPMLKLPDPDPNDETPITMTRPDGQLTSFPRYMTKELLAKGFKRTKWEHVEALNHPKYRNDYLPFMADDSKNLHDSQIKQFEEIAKMYEKEGLQIYNASERSTLKAFPLSKKLNRSGLTHKRGKNARSRQSSRPNSRAAASAAA